MKRNLILISVCLTALLSVSVTSARDKGVMSGTWECQAHGGTQGDTAFTLFLEQNKESVDGSISSAMGGTQISSGTFRHNMLEIHLDTPQGQYILMGKYKKGELSGTWSGESDKGTWEGKRQAHASK
jgi:hypothetical protein